MSVTAAEAGQCAGIGAEAVKAALRTYKFPAPADTRIFRRLLEAALAVIDTPTTERTP